MQIFKNASINKNANKNVDFCIPAEPDFPVTVDQSAVKASSLLEPGLARGLCSCSSESSLRPGSELQLHWDFVGREGWLLTWIADFWALFSLILGSEMFFPC